MDRLQRSIFWAVVAAESSHVFCCVLPTLFSIAGLLAGAGLIGVMPWPLAELHDALHAYEVPVIVASAALLALGWALHALSLRMDCHDTGCGHGPCTPTKRRASRILVIATCLFVANLAVYLVFHRGYEPHAHDHVHDAYAQTPAPAEQAAHGGHDHDHHGHAH